MQQFTVPQFIDVEAKIIGPITTRQFVIMLSGVIIGGISYRFFDFSLFITIAIFIFIMIGLFGFAKINGRPFHLFILHFIQTMQRAKLRVWNNALAMTSAKYEKDSKKTEIEFSPPPAEHYTTSRLAELSLIVDTGGAYQGEEEIDSKTDIKTI
jgi:hypothetical protein